MGNDWSLKRWTAGTTPDSDREGFRVESVDECGLGVGPRPLRGRGWFPTGP